MRAWRHATDGSPDQTFNGSTSTRPVGTTVSGGRGDESIIGGSGDDRLSGDEGNDTVRGESGDDHLEGNADVDHLFGGSGHDTSFFHEDDTFEDIEEIR